MKKINLYIAGIAAMLLGTGCSHELLLNTEGEGKLMLNASVSTDMKVISRSVEQDLIDNCMIWISSEKGLVRRYNTMADLPTDGINLVTGHYVAEAWTGDSVPASWDKRWFKGISEFDIEAGKTATVELVCKIANVGVSVHYAEGLENVLSDFTMTVGHTVDNLVFVGREERCGYFMMPSFDKNLTYTLTGKQIDDSEFNFTGTISGAQPGTEYVLNVKYNQETNEVGGAVITIEIDDHEIELTHDVPLVTAPKIGGYGFDINSPVMGEPGNVGRRTVYLTSATKIEHVQLTCNYFTQIGLGASFDILGVNNEGLTLINNAGINYKYSYDESNDETIMQLNFEPEFTNVLEAGDYSIEIRATDIKSHESVATLNLIVSEAPVITGSASHISYFTATLNGTASNEDVSQVGFKYRKVGETNWIEVASQLQGRSFSTEISGLYDNTQYEFVATSGDFTSGVTSTFTTLSAQLPNSGFEDWCTEGGVLIPGLSLASTFWDTGNHGSATMNKMVTEQSTSIKHSGKYAAALKSQFVGTLGIGKFAAGNIFAGNYLYTDGMDGELGWGRPFSFSPKSVKVWVRYEPGTVQSGNNKGSGTYMPVGSKDQGIIYLALVDDTKTTYTQSKSKFNNTEWPCIIKTKTSQLFDKDGDNVIAYGEYVFETATEGDGMIQIEIPLNYKKQGVTPSNIIFVGSASRYGDYFQGGEGSTLYMDDIELIYY